MALAGIQGAPTRSADGSQAEAGQSLSFSSTCCDTCCRYCASQLLICLACLDSAVCLYQDACPLLCSVKNTIVLMPQCKANPGSMPKHSNESSLEPWKVTSMWMGWGWLLWRCSTRYAWFSACSALAAVYLHSRAASSSRSPSAVLQVH